MSRHHGLRSHQTTDILRSHTHSARHHGHHHDHRHGHRRSDDDSDDDHRHHHDHDEEHVCMGNPLEYLRFAYLVDEAGNPTDSAVKYVLDTLPEHLNKHIGPNQLDTCLDLGTGPTVHNGALLSKYFDHLILSDKQDDARRLLEVELWGTEERQFDWTPFYQYVANTEGGSSTAESVRSRLVNSVTRVAECDVTLHDVGLPIEFAMKTFDAVATFGVLHLCCESFNDYTLALGNVAARIKPGGFLIYDDILGGESGEGAESSSGEGVGLALTEEIVLNTLKALSFTVLEHGSDTDQDKTEILVLAQKNI